MQMKLSIIVPCFDEEEVIRETNTSLNKLTGKLLHEKLIDDFEIIYVDDGSGDNTLGLLKEFALEDKRIKVISFSGNFGHQYALTAGLHHASGDAAVSLDADLQDPPEVIEDMLRKFNEGFEVVYGVRGKRDKDALFKRVTARLFYRLMKIMGVNLVYDHADYRLVSRNVLDVFKEYTEVNRFLRGIFPAMGFKQAVVEYERDERFAGKTKYPLGKMLAFAIEGVTSFSYVPLRFAAMLGFIIFVLSLLFTFWAFLAWMSGRVVPGWASTVLPLYLFGGIQLMFLGIIGEYIGKIYIEVKKRPLYVIKDKYNF
ncbi:MAG TPA: glycosyltransferase [Nitrospirae bacterium]|nr:glycosyltransferase [Nitrospirota bacterium]